MFTYLSILFLQVTADLFFACLFVMKHSAAENSVDSFALENIMFLIQHS